MARALHGFPVGIDRDRPSVLPLGDTEEVVTLLDDFATGRKFRPEFGLLRDAETTCAVIIDGPHCHFCRAGPDEAALFCFSNHGAQENASPGFWSVKSERLDEALACPERQADRRPVLPPRPAWPRSSARHPQRLQIRFC